MSDDLQQQIEKLKEKNYQVLDEKKKAQAERDEAQAALEAVTTERDTANAELQRITVEQPRQSLFEAVAADGMAGAFERELMHHFNIERDDNGNDLLVAKEGDADPVALTAENLNKLYEDDHVKALGAFLKGSGASGGGATGGAGELSSQSKPTPAPRVHFGMR